VDDDEDEGGGDFHIHEVVAWTLLTGLCVDVASFLGDDNLYTAPVNRTALVLKPVS